MHPRAPAIPLSDRNAIWEANCRKMGVDPKAIGYPEPEFKSHELERNPQDKPQK